MSTKTGKVKEITGSGAGRSAKIHSDVPLPDGEDITWTDPPADAWTVLVACYTKGSDCEIGIDDATGAKTSAKGK